LPAGDFPEICRESLGIDGTRALPRKRGDTAALAMSKNLELSKADEVRAVAKGRRKKIKSDRLWKAVFSEVQYEIRNWRSEDPGIHIDQMIVTRERSE
jgi:hypothetical protein